VAVLQMLQAQYSHCAQFSNPTDELAAQAPHCMVPSNGEPAILCQRRGTMIPLLFANRLVPMRSTDGGAP